jgi:hypothetical protein
MHGRNDLEELTAPEVIDQDKNISQYRVYNNSQLIYNSNHNNKSTNYQTDHHSDP